MTRSSFVLFLLLAATGTAAGQRPAERWTLTPELRVGSADGPDALSDVTALAVDAQGTIYAAEPMARAVRVFDARGRLLRTIGRRGSGPGEFQNPYSLGLRGDTLWVSDPGLGRTSFFGRDGRFLRSVGQAGEPLADGTVLVAVSVPMEFVARGAVTAIPHVRYRRSGAVLDTLLRRSTRREVFAVDHASGKVMTVQPFRDSPVWKLAPRGEWGVLVERAAAARGGTAHFRVLKIAPSGDTLSARTYAYAPRPLAPALAERVVDAQVAALRNPGGRGPGVMVPAARVRERMYLPAFLPPITDVLVGEDGTVWLRREDAGEGASVEWTVLGPRGEVLATLAVPRAVRVLAARRGAVWGLTLDELDVPYLVRYRVR